MDLLACTSMRKAMELDGRWPTALSVTTRSGQQQLAPDLVLWNTLISGSCQL